MTHPAPRSTGPAGSTGSIADMAGLGSFVSVSHVTVDVSEGGRGTPGRDDEVRAEEVLERAFADRLGDVEGEAGFQRLEVWRDVKRAGAYVMVTWWDSEADFRSYLRSDAHDRSHARVPSSPVRPRGAGLDRYQVIAR